MYTTAMNKRAAILAKITKKPNQRLPLPGMRPHNKINQQAIPISGFAPVEITDLPEKESNQVEVFFPSGVQVVLSGSQSLQGLTTLLKQGF